MSPDRHFSYMSNHEMRIKFSRESRVCPTDPVPPPLTQLSRDMGQGVTDHRNRASNVPTKVPTDGVGGGEEVPWEKRG